MDKAKEQFEQKKAAEVKLYDTAARIIDLIEGFSKEEQRKVWGLVDDALKVTPKPVNDYWYER